MYSTYTTLSFDASELGSKYKGLTTGTTYTSWVPDYFKELTKQTIQMKNIKNADIVGH